MLLRGVQTGSEPRNLGIFLDVVVRSQAWSVFVDRNVHPVRPEPLSPIFIHDDMNGSRKRFSAIYIGIGHGTAIVLDPVARDRLDRQFCKPMSPQAHCIIIL